MSGGACAAGAGAAGGGCCLRRLVFEEDLVIDGDDRAGQVADLPEHFLQRSRGSSSRRTFGLVHRVDHLVEIEIEDGGAVAFAVRRVGPQQRLVELDEEAQRRAADRALEQQFSRRSRSRSVVIGSSPRVSSRSSGIWTSRRRSPFSCGFTANVISGVAGDARQAEVTARRAAQKIGGNTQPELRDVVEVDHGGADAAVRRSCRASWRRGAPARRTARCQLSIARGRQQLLELRRLFRATRGTSRRTP